MTTNPIFQRKSKLNPFGAVYVEVRLCTVMRINVSPKTVLNEFLTSYRVKGGPSIVSSE